MDLRIKKTKANISEAFIALRSKKQLEKITIKELCERAQINKSTFYTYYQDIYNLSDQLETEAVDSILKQLEHPEYVIERPEEFTHALYQGHMAKDQLIQILFSGSRRSVLVHKIERSIKEFVFSKYPELRTDEYKNIVLTFCIYGGFFTFFENRQYEDSRVIDVISHLSATLSALKEESR